MFYSRVVLDKDEVASEMFEIICVFCSRFRGYIPITFLTGFYVSEVVRRYWDQFMNLPFPDRLALKLVSYVPGKVSTVIPVCNHQNDPDLFSIG